MNTRSSPSSPRYQSLDLWRGVACLTVLVFHSTFYWNGGAAWSDALGAVFARLWLGVPLFFVISGYCIAASCDSTRRSDRAVWPFFVRRWRRIFPPFWIFLALTVVLVGATELTAPGTFTDSVHPISAPWAISAGAWLGNFTLIETWRYNFSGTSPQFFVGHAWTLCYEEQFYAIAGIVVWVASKRIFAAFSVVTIAVLLLGVIPGAPDHVGGTLADGRWFLFATGIAVYWARNYASGTGRRVTKVTLLVALVLLVIGYRSSLIGREAVLSQEYVTAAAFGLVLLLLSQKDGAIAANRWSRPLMWTGKMCYSVYLLHWPIVKLVSHFASTLGPSNDLFTLVVVLPACAGLSLAVAWQFHVTVERRFLSTRGFQTRHPEMSGPTISVVEGSPG